MTGEELQPSSSRDAAGHGRFAVAPTARAGCTTPPLPECVLESPLGRAWARVGTAALGVSVPGPEGLCKVGVGLMQAWGPGLYRAVATGPGPGAWDPPAASAGTFKLCLMREAQGRSWRVLTAWFSQGKPSTSLPSLSIRPVHTTSV